MHPWHGQCPATPGTFCGKKAMQKLLERRQEQREGPVQAVPCTDTHITGWCQYFSKWFKTLGSKVGVFITRNIPQKICFQIKMWKFKGDIGLQHNKEVDSLPG